MQLIQLLVEFAIFGLLLYVAFFKSYFQEKGKNLATKEDISHITDLVESVKSRLQLSLQAKINLKREEHDAVMTYYVALSSWLQSISSCGFSGINYENMERLNTLQQQLDEMHYSTKVSLAKAEVLVKDYGLLLAARTIMIKVVEIHHHALVKFAEYRLLCIETHRAKLQCQTPEQLEKYRETCNAEVNFFREFKTEQVNMYTVLFPEVEKHRQQVSAHLLAIAESS